MKKIIAFSKKSKQHSINIHIHSIKEKAQPTAYSANEIAFGILLVELDRLVQCNDFEETMRFRGSLLKSKLIQLDNIYVRLKKMIERESEI